MIINKIAIVEEYPDYLNKKLLLSNVHGDGAKPTPLMVVIYYREILSL